MLRRLGAVLASTALLAGVSAAGVAVAQEAPGGNGDGSAAAEPVDLRVAVTAKRFRLDGDRAYARGPMTLQATEDDGTVRTIQRQVALRVKQNSNKCKILKLHLAELYVDLLGLEVRTSEINLEITGESKRALGKLFCKLSEGLKLDKSKLARKTVHSLNRRLDGRELHVLRVNTRLYAQHAEPAAAYEPDGPRCQILDLDLGPLELDLLGLVVNLYGPDRKSPVHVDADADPNGGVLGEALCELSGGPQP